MNTQIDCSLDNTLGDLDQSSLNVNLVNVKNMEITLKNKQKQFQQVFQQLSSVRSEYRVIKQQNQWYKTVKSGLQEQNNALKEILKQKKLIIGKMTEQIEEKINQLNQLQKQLQIANQKSSFYAQKLQNYQKQTQSLRRELQIVNGELKTKDQLNQELQEQLIHKQNQKRSLLQSEKKRKSLQNTENLEKMKKQITRNIQIMDSYMNKIDNSYRSPHKSQRLVSSTYSQMNENKLQEKIEKILKMNMELVKKSQKINQQLQITKQKLNQATIKIDQYQQVIQQKQKLILDKSQQVQKQQLNIKQLTSKLLNIHQNQGHLNQRNKEKINNLNSINEQLKIQIQKFKDQVQNHKRNSIDTYLPFIRPFLPQELLELTKKLLTYTSEQNYYNIIKKQIDKLCSLHLCKQSHYEKLEQINMYLKNQMVQLKGQNQILLIKINNLQRAYQNAIDDYRRSMRFKSICRQSNVNYAFRNSGTNKQNEINNRYD